MTKRNPKKIRTQERACTGCGVPVLVAVTLPDGRSLRRHPGRGGAIYCGMTCRVRAFRRKRRRKA